MRQLARHCFAAVLAAVVILALDVAPGHGALNPKLRYAVVVGNENYGFSPLDNPVNDARSIAGALGELGFEVTLLEDATLTTMRGVVERIAATFEADGIALFYYAGHAVQHRGVNYLLPTDFELDENVDLAGESVDINSVLGAMERSGSGLNLIILDSCRDYPFGDVNEAFGQGLAGVSTGGETLVAYATAAGKVALDGYGPNSPYSAALISALELPGYDIYDVFRLVRAKVREATNGLQLPWVSGSIETRVVLRDGTPGPVAQLANRPTLPLVHWTTIRASVNPGDFESFLRSHPSSPFAGEAVARLQTLLAEGRTRQGPVVVREEAIATPGGGVLNLTACDAFASDPDDPRRIAPGTEWGLVNTREAIRACSTAVADHPDNPRLNYNLGRTLDIAERFDEAIEFYRKAADASYAIALKNLGYMHRTGRGQVRNYTKAADFYLQAALLGLPSARTALAKLYELGWGVPESNDESLRWLRLAAADAFAPALDHLGNVYRMGLGLDPDPSEAARNYRTAAVLGNDNAMANLARLYRDGSGVPQDIDEALAWYQRATDEGNPYAPYHWGLILRKGQQVQRDPRQAFDLFELAADRGNEWAYWQLADMYEKGEVGDPDPSRAYFYLWIARAAGEERRNEGAVELARMANNRLDLLRRELDDATAIAMEQEAETWLAQNSLFRFTLISPY